MRLSRTLIAIAVAATGWSCTQATPNTPAPPATPSCADLQPGEVPPASCEEKQTCPTTMSCSIDEAKCGSVGTCMPMVHNAGLSTSGFRMRKFQFSAPARLTDPAFQAAIIDLDVELKQPVCGTPGRSGFNWLLAVDREHGSLVTGSGPPPMDPAAGFCFFPKVDGTRTGAVTTSVTFKGDTFDSAVIPRLDIPILSQGNIHNLVTVPMQAVRFAHVTVSDDGDCIGRFNPTALDADCLPHNPAACAPWTTAGAVAGFITLEDADEVTVANLQSSLCAFLTGDPGPDGKCAQENGHIRAKGDYCSSSQAAGGCADSYWLAATFAASAVDVRTNDCAN